jgi:hypothetical protein
MFGRQVVTQQIVSLDELARFINQIVPQSQPGTSITIYVQELHVHVGEPAAYQMLGRGAMQELPAPRGCQVVDTPSPWDYAPPAQYRR